MSNRLAPLLAVLAFGVGCNHITTKVPGVLDLRSDGSDAAVDSTAPKEAPRAGFDGLLWGDGVQGSGQVTVVDRKYWLLNLLAMGNESATEEINAAMGDGGLKGVTIGEQYTLGDFGIGFCASGIPIAGCFVSPGQGPRVVKLSATRVKAGAVEVAPIVEAAPTDAAPAPASDATGGY